MVECIVAWILLVVGIIEDEAMWLVASGIFAVACQLDWIWKDGIKDGK